MRKLIPVILALVGTGAGVAAGLFLTPAQPQPQAAKAETVDCVPPAEPAHLAIPARSSGPPAGREYVKMSNQFVVPVIHENRVSAMVVASLSLEVTEGETSSVFDLEPKLRDAFLQVMLDHANFGGFDGNFTSAARMQPLRAALYEAARPVLGPIVSDVLITEIARQDS